MSKVRFLMLGLGGMGRAHIENLRTIPEVEIVGLVDPSEAAISSTRTAYPELTHTPSFADFRQALAEIEADAAVIVTPHSQHLEQGWACLDAGLHVLMEKPFVAGSDNAKRLIDQAEKTGKHLAVSYQRHLQGPYMYLRQLVQSGALGEIQFVMAYQSQAWQKGTVGSWRQDPALSCGGQLNDSGSHLLDVILWVTGLEPVEVSAYIDQRGTQVDIDTALTVKFRGGALCTFNIVGSASIDWWEDVSIHGTKGTALYRNGQLWVAPEGSRSPARVEDSLPDSSNPDQNFVDLILGRIPSAAATSASGLAVATLTEAAWKSAAEGRSIQL